MSLISHNDTTRIENMVLCQISKAEKDLYFYTVVEEGSKTHFETVLNLVLDSDLKSISETSLKSISETVLKCLRIGRQEITWLNSRYEDLGVDSMNFDQEKTHFSWVTKSTLEGARF